MHPKTWANLIFEGRINVNGLYLHLQFTRGSATQKIMHDIKYNNNVKLAHYIGNQFARLRLMEQVFDAIIPIPIHKSKLVKRGYNQSERIAQGIGEIIQCPILSNCLSRIHEIESQTEKSRIERFENTANVFKVEKSSLPNNARLLVIDDTLTTGATLESAVKTLNTAGYNNISLGCIAYAQK